MRGDPRDRRAARRPTAESRGAESAATRPGRSADSTSTSCARPSFAPASGATVQVISEGPADPTSSSPTRTASSDSRLSAEGRQSEAEREPRGRTLGAEDPRQRLLLPLRAPIEVRRRRWRRRTPRTARARAGGRVVRPWSVVASKKTDAMGREPLPATSGLVWPSRSRFLSRRRSKEPLTPAGSEPGTHRAGSAANLPVAVELVRSTEAPDRAPRPSSFRCDAARLWREAAVSPAPARGGEGRGRRASMGRSGAESHGRRAAQTTTRSERTCSWSKGTRTARASRRWSRSAAAGSRRSSKGGAGGCPRTLPSAAYNSRPDCLSLLQPNAFQEWRKTAAAADRDGTLRAAFDLGPATLAVKDLLHVGMRPPEPSIATSTRAGRSRFRRPRSGQTVDLGGVVPCSRWLRRTVVRRRPHAMPTSP